MSSGPQGPIFKPVFPDADKLNQTFCLLPNFLVWNFQFQQLFFPFLFRIENTPLAMLGVPRS